MPLELVAIEEDGDEKKHQDDDEEVVKGSILVRRGPLYKELYQASRKRDAKLKSLEFEVRLAEEGRLGLERLAEVLPRITPKKEVWLSWICFIVLFSHQQTMCNKVVGPNEFNFA